MQAFLFLAFVFLSFIRKNSSSLLQSYWIARSRESIQDSCRLVKPSRASHRLKNGVAIFADSEQRPRPLPFLSRTGNVLHAFLLQSFCILAFLKENIPLPDSNLNSHLSNLYFSLVTRLLNSLICLFLSTLQPLSSCLSPVFSVSLRSML